MHIGLLTTSFPRFEGDVAGSFVLGFARALAARGHRLRVLAPEPLEGRAASSFSTTSSSTKDRAPAIEVRHVPYVRPRYLARTFYGAGVADNVRDPRAWPGLALFPVALLAAARALDGCDAIVSHFGVPCGLVASRVRHARPHVAVLHSADLRALERMPFGASLATSILDGADHVTCVSQHARATLLGMLPAARRGELEQRVHVQAMGTDAKALASVLPSRRAARERLGVRGELTLVTLARLVPIKGLLEALEAIGPCEGVEWIIAGDGPLRRELEHRAASARARVRLVGEVRGAAKLALLAAADALLLPSLTLSSGRAEGAPVALLEAMAAGLPVIASSTGGIPELLDFGRAGVLFDPRDHEALRRGLQAVQREPNRSQRVALAREIALAHDWSIVGERYEGWLQRA